MASLRAREIRKNLRLVWALLLLTVHWQAVATETRAGINKNNIFGQSRIVNGQPAVDGRYPYAVTLVVGSNLFCGGSLIAPDIVLTAAHCGSYDNTSVEIGRYNRSDFLENYDRIVVDQKIIHPLYKRDESVRYDVMLLKLSEMTQSELVRVNLDDSLPPTGEVMTVMGWGLTDPDNNDSISSVLQEAQVTAMSNAECEKASNPSFPLSSYANQIYPDMLCAYEEGQDSCQGDSGGPLVMETSDGDLQVGVVSWGFGCAIDFFPGVYSRTSYDRDWLVNTVCETSDDPPSYFNCTVSSPVASPGSSSPVASPNTLQAPSPGMLLASLTIQMDGYPQEIGWRLEKIGDVTEIIVQRTPGVYRTPDALIEETIAVEAGEVYSFTIYDIFKDGICCRYGQGYYKLEVGDQVVADAQGDFGEGQEYTFLVGSIETPAPAPVQAGDLFLELEIQFDQYPQEIGWMLRLNEGSSTGTTEVVAFHPAGSYPSTSFLSQLHSEVIPIPEGGNYTFHFLDAFGDGVCCESGSGYYRLYEGSIEDNMLLASGTAEGTTRESTSFQISALSSLVPDNTTASNQTTVSVAPQASPTGTNVSSGADIQIDIGSFDGNAQGIGWIIKDESGVEVASKAPGSYTDAEGGEISEVVRLEGDSLYTIILQNTQEQTSKLGDGIFQVSTDNGIVGYGASGFAGSPSVHFATPGSIPVTLDIKTDSFPEEIIWRLERIDLEKSATVALGSGGTYTTPYEPVTEQFMVSTGAFYRFTIEDVKSDGICCKYGDGAISLEVDGELLISEAGQYTTSASYHFLVDSLEVPILSSIANPRSLSLTINFDKYPGEISWILFQNDADSSVSVSRSIQGKGAKIAGYGPRDVRYPSTLQGTTLNEVIEIEQVPVGSVRSYKFVLMDAQGDGLCCDWGAGNYTLSDGDTVIFTGNAFGEKMEAFPFSLTADGVASAPAPTPLITSEPTSSSSKNSMLWSVLLATLTSCVLGCYARF